MAKQISIDTATDSDASKHILIVDNNPAMGRILGRIIIHSDMQFSIARNGAEAVEFCKTTNYDLILVEARMPGMGGCKTAQKIRTLNDHCAKIPILAIDTEFSEDAIKRNRACGITAELKKPVIEFNLQQAFAAHLGATDLQNSLHPPEDDEIYALLDEDEMDLLNWDTLKEYNAVLKDDFKRLLRDFLMVSPDLIGDIGEAVVDKDAKKIEFLAHQLKSTSLIFGAEHVSNAAAKLELLGHENMMADANQYYKDLHVSFERVRPVLHKKWVLMNSPT